MLGKIRGFQGCDYEECRFLGCDAVWLLQDLTFHLCHQREMNQRSHLSDE
jgi:hypothetical protein